MKYEQKVLDIEKDILDLADIIEQGKCLGLHDTLMQKLNRLALANLRCELSILKDKKQIGGEQFG